jgi:hypothetical protein
MGRRMFLLVTALCYNGACGFSLGRTQTRVAPLTALPVSESSTNIPFGDNDSRRVFFSQVATITSSVVGLSLPLPAFAVGGLSKVNSKLQGYVLFT